jgi:ATP synthase F1 delta subunit
MSNKKFVTAYSKSLFQSVNILSHTKIADEKLFTPDYALIDVKNLKNYVPSPATIGEELLLIRTTLITSKKVKEYFNNPTYPEKIKLEILRMIFPGLTNTMKAFLKLLTDRSHLSLIPEICDDYHALLSKFENSTKVKLIVGSILPKFFGKSVLRKLQDLTKSKGIVLSVSYNPNILGGLIFEYNSIAVDASFLTDLSRFFNEI